MASLQHDDAVRYPARQRAGRAALLAFALVAACGGDRNRTTGADTVGASTVTPDSAAMPVHDTAAPAATGSSRDSSRDTTRSAAPSIATKPSAAVPAKPAPTTAERPTRTPDTAKKHAAAPSPKPAATPAPVADTSAQQPKPAATAAAPSSAQDGQATSGNADAPLRDAYHQAPRDTVSQAVYNGWKQFNLNCARCHGEDVSGTTIAPHLIVSLKPDGPINTKELFMQTVCAGRPAKGMPAWCTLGLGMDKINEIYQYVKGRSDAKISPGRPAVKPQG
jgi:hypothetical protein